MAALIGDDVLSAVREYKSFVAIIKDFEETSNRSLINAKFRNFRFLKQFSNIYLDEFVFENDTLFWKGNGKKAWFFQFWHNRSEVNAKRGRQKKRKTL